MIEAAFAAAWATPGLGWLALTAAIAGVVFGYAGFGTALIFMPVATVFLPPRVAVACLEIMTLSSLVVIVPPAWAVCDRRATAGMIGVALVFIPAGVLVLRVADPDFLRWAVTGLATVTLAALLLGWRRRGADTTPARLGVAAAAGFTGGATGLNGPVLVLFHLSGRAGAATIRANSAVFLVVTGAAVLPVMVAQGLVSWADAALGLLLFGPYALGSLVGRAVFRPERDGLYRGIAYAIIGGAILVGLPVWG